MTRYAEEHHSSNCTTNPSHSLGGLQYATPLQKSLLEAYHKHCVPGPLNGVIVVGFCYYLAGPVALQNLVSQGALVFKIEAGESGDPSRTVFAGPMFNSLAHGQLSFSVKNQEDHKALSELLQAAKVIVDNRSVGAKQRDSQLKQHLENPDKAPQVYCSIDGFPNASLNTNPGLDASAQALTGMAYTNCASPDKPMKVGFPVLDMTSGMLAAQNIIANLFRIARGPLPPETKNVIKISVSLAGMAVWLQTGQILSAMNGKEALRSTNQDQFAAPFSYYTANDGLISIATVNEKQFEKFCQHVICDMEFHAKFPTVNVRLAKQNEFETNLNEILKTKTRTHWCQLCESQGIPAAPVLTVTESIQQPFVQPLIKKTTDEEPIVTAGVENSLFHSTKTHRPAPSFGQDNARIHAAVQRSGPNLFKNQAPVTLAKNEAPRLKACL